MRLRAVVHPPDLMLVPEVSRIGPLEFYRGKEAVVAGYKAAQEKIAELKALLRPGC